MPAAIRAQMKIWFGAKGKNLLPWGNFEDMECMKGQGGRTAASLSQKEKGNGMNSLRGMKAGNVVLRLGVPPRKTYRIRGNVLVPRHSGSVPPAPPQKKTMSALSQHIPPFRPRPSSPPGDSCLGFFRNHRMRNTGRFKKNGFFAGCVIDEPRSRVYCFTQIGRQGRGGC